MKEVVSGFKFSFWQLSGKDSFADYSISQINNLYNRIFTIIK